MPPVSVAPPFNISIRIRAVTMHRTSDRTDSRDSIVFVSSLALTPAMMGRTTALLIPPIMHPNRRPMVIFVIPSMK